MYSVLAEYFLVSGVMATLLAALSFSVLSQPDGKPEDTCETQYLRIDGMDQNAALRSLRFIRLWRKLGWTMRDLDRTLSICLLSYQTLHQLVP